MYKLGLLIVCLLVGFRGISQIVTQKNDSVVTLSETISRKVVSDLVRYDFAKNVLKEQEIRIKNYQKKEIEFNNKLDIKDSIIFHQKSLIGIQKDIIKTKHPLEIHGYAGVQSIKLQQVLPSLYGNIMFEYKNWSTGVNYTIQTHLPPTWGIVIEHKVF